LAANHIEKSQQLKSSFPSFARNSIRCMIDVAKTIDVKEKQCINTCI